MSLKKMILSLCLLALMPMMVPSLMREAYVHPSIQAPNLSNETTTILVSPVDFIGTVEMEPIVPSSSPIDTIQGSSNYFAKEVKTAVILASKDFFNDVFAQSKLLGEKTQAFINGFLSDTLIILDTFSFATTDAIDRMSTIFEQFNKKLRAAAQDFSAVIKSKYQKLFNNENFETFIGELASLAPRRSDIPSISRNIFNKISVECQVAFKNFGSSAMASFSTRAPEPSSSFAIQLEALKRFGRRISLKSQLVYEKLELVVNEWFASVSAPAYPSSFVVDSSIIADAVQTSYSAAFQAYMKLESLVFPVPEPAPTSFESITRDVLDKVALEFQQRFNEKMVASFLNDLLAPVTPPPSSFCIQPITAAYKKLETFVANLFFAPPPPPPRTFQSIARDVWKTFSVVGYEQAYERLENYYSIQLRSFQWNSLFC